MNDTRKVLCLLAAAGMTGCGTVGRSIARGKRTNAAGELPLMLDGKKGGDFPDPAGLAEVEVEADVYQQIDPKKTTLCHRGRQPPEELLKQVQDALGGANLYHDAAATQEKSLPFSAEDLETITFECSADKIVLGVNGEAIAPDWVAGFVGDAASGGRVLHLLGVSQASGDALWIYIHFEMGKAKEKVVRATNLKRYLVPSYQAFGAIIFPTLHYQAEFLLVEKDKSGLYLFFDRNEDEPKIARFRVGG